MQSNKKANHLAAFPIAILHQFCYSLAPPLDSAGALGCCGKLWTAEQGIHSYWIFHWGQVIDCWWVLPNDSGPRAVPGFRLDWKGTVASPQLTQKGMSVLRVCFLSSLNLLTDFSARPDASCQSIWHFCEHQPEGSLPPAHTWGATLLWQEAWDWSQSF